MTNQTQTQQPIPQVVVAILDIAEALGIENIKELPGAWEVDIGNGWFFAVNGHQEPLTIQPDNCMKAEIPGTHFAVWYAGWLVGLFNAADGVFASGQAINEAAFIRAAQNFIHEVKNTNQT